MRHLLYRPPSTDRRKTMSFSGGLPTADGGQMLYLVAIHKPTPMPKISATKSL
jgi:hypothetical protein